MFGGPGLTKVMNPTGPVEILSLYSGDPISFMSAQWGMT